MFYLIYKITNIVNGKIYIGSHKTKNKDDGYMGSGKYLGYAYDKHGIDRFVKEILFVFDNAAEMYAKEAELVNDDFLSEGNTYNLKRGGLGGFDYLNNWKENPSHSKEHLTRMSHAVPIEKRRKSAKLGMQKYKEMLVKNGNKIWWTHPNGFAGKQHSDDTKHKMSQTKSGQGVGNKNSQFGTMWITNEISNAKISKDNMIPTGWRKGRV
jgi:hypothetical protein